MNEYPDTLILAIEKLRRLDFTVNFHLKDNCLTHPKGQLKVDDFIIVDVYKYEVNCDPAHQAAVYAIESYSRIKSIHVIGYGISVNFGCDQKLKKLLISNWFLPYSINPNSS